MHDHMYTCVCMITVFTQACGGRGPPQMSFLSGAIYFLFITGFLIVLETPT